MNNDKIVGALRDLQDRMVEVRAQAFNVSAMGDGAVSKLCGAVFFTIVNLSDEIDKFVKTLKEE